MNIVMFHSGELLPIYLKDNFQQLRLFNPDIPVYFITDSFHMPNPVFSAYNIIVDDMSKYISRDIYNFEVLYGRGKADFWTITTTRLMYIENFMFSNKMHDVCHFENDVLIYTDIKKLKPLLTKLYKDLAITVGGPDKCMTGFLFIKKPEALRRMTYFFVELLRQNGVHKVKKQYGMDMVNEMTLMRAYSKEYPDMLRFLPSLPFGEYSENYDKFDSIFDPASWGQFVGGTLDGRPGAKPGDHYIGCLLKDNPEYTVKWVTENNRKIPYFQYNGSMVRINNLHIHSKQLNKYIS